MIETMRPLLQRPRSEFLINFAYNFINRTASMPVWQDAMMKLLGATVTRQQRTGVVDLFDTEPQLDPSDGRCSPEDVDAFWRRHLAAGERRVGTAEFADILEATNWLPGDLQASLVRLVKAGVVLNLDADASRRRSKPLHFDKAERLRLSQS